MKHDKYFLKVLIPSTIAKNLLEEGFLCQIDEEAFAKQTYNEKWPYIGWIRENPDRMLTVAMTCTLVNPYTIQERCKRIQAVPADPWPRDSLPKRAKWTVVVLDKGTMKATAQKARELQVPANEFRHLVAHLILDDALGA